MERDFKIKDFYDIEIIGLETELNYNVIDVQFSRTEHRKPPIPTIK